MSPFSRPEMLKFARRLPALALAAALVVALPAVACAATVFGVIGDYGNLVDDPADDGVQAMNVANMVAGWNPDFIITVGDNNYGRLGDGAADFGDWEANVGSLYGQFMLGRVDGRYPTQTSLTQRFFPAIGNHDTGGPGADSSSGGTAAGYLDFFHSNPGGAARLPTGSGQQLSTGTYYDFVQDNAHFFVIDSDHAITSGTSLSAQSAWLQAGLANSTSDWNFVYMHHPAYSSGVHGNTASLQLPYIQWGAHAVFAGHDHNLERIMVGGYPYFISGTAGRDPRPFSSIQPGQAFGSAVDQGALRVTLDNNLATFDFFTPGNPIALDSFTLDLNNLPQLGQISSGVDTSLRGADPAVAQGASATFGWDQESGGSPEHGLLRFDIPQNMLDAFNAASNPRARLQLNVTDAGDKADLHRATVDWVTGQATLTWNNIPGGPGLVAGANVAVAASATTSNSLTFTGVLNVDVTADVAAWAAGAQNFGWGFLPKGTNGVDIASFESVTPPILILENRFAGSSFEQPGLGAKSFVSIGDELGFTRMIDANGDGTFGDEDAGGSYGVKNSSSLAGVFPTTDGAQVYEVTGSNGSGQPVNKLTFDAVNVDGLTGVSFSIDVYVSATDWETGDLLKIALKADNGSQVDELKLIDTTGLDIDNLATVTEGSWRTYSMAIDDQYESLVLELTNSSNSSSLAEKFYYDNITFTVPLSPVPEPSSVDLAALGAALLMAMWLVHRRRLAHTRPS